MVINNVNNQNALRYVHMRLSKQSGGGGEVTPEEIEAILKEIMQGEEFEQMLSDILSERDFSILDFGEDEYAYGVLIDFTQGNSSPDLVRIGNMELHRTLPVQSEYKGCIWDYQQQKVLYYLNPENWNLAVNDEVHGVTKTAAEVEADMKNPKYGIRVETPKFYARSQVLATDGAGHTTMAKVMFSTRKINQYYIEIPRQVTDFRNIRVGSSLNENEGPFGLYSNMYVGNDMYGGYADSKDSTNNHTTAYLYPFTNLTRGLARTAARVGSHTHLMCYDYYKWLFYWAFIIEYATLNSHKPVINELDENGFHQGGLGGGLTGLIESNGIDTYDTNSAKDTCRYIGVTNELGNSTGELNILTNNGQNTGHPNRYRGFECPFGDICLVLDGFVGTTMYGEDGNSPLAEVYYATSNPKLFTDLIPSDFNASFEAIEDWRIAYQDASLEKYANQNQFDGAAKSLYIGNSGEIFAQAWYTDSNYEFEKYFVNCNYPIWGSDKTLLDVGSLADHANAPFVGLGHFDASFSVSFAYHYLGFRCFNIINDNGIDETDFSDAANWDDNNGEGGGEGGSGGPM